MENTLQPKQTTKPKKKVSTVSLRVQRDTKKRIQDRISEINKNKLGSKKISADQLLSFALGLLTSSHFDQLKEMTMTNADRLELAYSNHIKTKGEISKDEFIGRLLNANVQAE